MIPTPPAVMSPTLRLYSRPGCCLCEGLEGKLRALNLPMPLEVVNVDLDPELERRFGLAVPVLSLFSPTGEHVLPRVPPRLAGQPLLVWLQRHGFSPGSA